MNENPQETDKSGALDDTLDASQWDIDPSRILPADLKQFDEAKLKDMALNSRIWYQEFLKSPYFSTFILAGVLIVLVGIGIGVYCKSASRRSIEEDEETDTDTEAPSRKKENSYLLAQNKSKTNSKLERGYRNRENSDSDDPIGPLKRRPLNVLDKVNEPEFVAPKPIRGPSISAHGNNGSNPAPPRLPPAVTEWKIDGNNKIQVNYNLEKARYEMLEYLPKEWMVINKQFGVELKQAPSFYVSGYDEKIPGLLIFLKNNFVSNGGLRQNGAFFRDPNDLVACKGYADEIDDANFDPLSVRDPNVYGYLMKLYFSRMPKSLYNDFEPEFVKAIITMNYTANEINQKVRTVAQEPERSVLLYVLDFLCLVSEYGETNGANTTNLAHALATSVLDSKNKKNRAIINGAVYFDSVENFTKKILEARLTYCLQSKTTNI